MMMVKPAAFENNENRMLLLLELLAQVQVQQGKLHWLTDLLESKWPG